MPRAEHTSNQNLNYDRVVVPTFQRGRAGFHGDRIVGGHRDHFHPGGVAIVGAYATSQFEVASVKNFSRKIMLLEEQATKKLGEAYDLTANVVTDSRLAPGAGGTGDAPAKKCEVGFGDGHVQPVTVAFGRNITTCQADFSQPFRNQPNQFSIKP